MPDLRSFSFALLRRLRGQGALRLTLVALSVLRVIGAVDGPISDCDVWWIAAAGRQMLASAAIIERNLFSFTDPEQPWVMHEWLFGPLYAWGLSHFGPAFFAAVGVLLFTAAAALLAAGVLSAVRSPSRGLMLVIFALLVFHLRLETPRPTHVAVLFPLGMAVLAFAPRFTRSRALACTALELLWANCHGSFPLGILLLLLAAAEQAPDRRRRLAAAAAAAVATLLNPYGLRVHRLVFGYALTKHEIYREIGLRVDEFQSVFAAHSVSLPQIVGLFACGLLALSALFQIRFRLRAAFCVLLVLMAIRQVRHIELAGLLTCLLLAPHFEALIGPLGQAAGEPEPQARRFAASLAGIVLVAGALALGIRIRFHPEREWVSSSFLEALDAVPDGARLYAPFENAGMAVWYGFGRGVRVYFDSRNDCYRPETLRDFMQIGFRETPTRTVEAQLSKRDTDHLLFADDGGLERRLDPQRWQRLGRVGSWQVFELNPRRASAH